MKKSYASRFLVTVSLVSGRTNVCTNVSWSRTHSMNLSVTRMDMLALVTLSTSVLTAMNSSRSGCSQERVSIRAPRLPCCPMRPVTME